MYFVPKRYRLGSVPETPKRPPEKSCGCGLEIERQGCSFLKKMNNNDSLRSI